MGTPEIPFAIVPNESGEPQIKIDIRLSLNDFLAIYDMNAILARLVVTGSCVPGRRDSRKVLALRDINEGLPYLTGRKAGQVLFEVASKGTPQELQKMANHFGVYAGLCENGLAATTKEAVANLVNKGWLRKSLCLSHSLNA